MSSKIVWVLLTSVLLLVCTGAGYAASAATLSAGCYAIGDPKDQPSVDTAQEILCVDESGHAVIRESSFFGDGIKGCNVVKVMSQGDELVVDIDYKSCTNNSPSHKLVCHPGASAGTFACSDEMGSRAEDKTQVKLAPLPAAEK